MPSGIYSRSLLLASLALLWPSGPILAQSSPLPPVLALSSQGPNGVLSTFNADLGIQSDVIFGRSGVNSYPLSWRGTRPNSESVVVEGQTLRRDLDYSFDNLSGTIRFAQPLSSGIMARITYSIDAAGATRNTPAFGAPLNWDLWQSGSNRLRLTMLPQQTDQTLSASSSTNANSSFGRNALQWNGSNRILHNRSQQSQIDSKLYLDLNGGDLLQHSGLSLASRNHLGRTDLSFSYARAGALFAQSTDSGLASGTEIYEAKIATVSRIAKDNVTVNGGFRQTTQLPTPPTTTTTGNAIPATPPVTVIETNAAVAIELAKLNKTRVSASISDRYQQDGLYRTGEAKIQLPKLPIGQTQLSGGIQYSSDPKQERVVGILSASTRPHRYLELSGDAQLRDSILTEEQTNPNALNTYALRMRFVPIRLLTLTGDVTLNPQQDGTPRRARRNSVGLTTTMGDFVLRGQFGIEEDLVTSHATDTSEFGLDVRLTRYDRLTTTFRGQNFFDHSNPGTYTYLVGYTRRFGSALDLSLNGSYTLPTYGNDPNRTEMKTEARLGIKF